MADRWQGDWKMEPLRRRRAMDGDGQPIWVMDHRQRYAVHTPSGVRVMFVLDDAGGLVRAEAEGTDSSELMMQAMEFCVEYLNRARNRHAN
jgi:hypothetical protein